MGNIILGSGGAAKSSYTVLKDFGLFDHSVGIKKPKD